MATVFALVVAVFGVGFPVNLYGAQVIFAAPLTPGLFPTDSEAGFVKGMVKVYSDRTVEFTIVGAQPLEIERLFPILKEAYRVESLRLATLARIERALRVFSVVAWPIFNMPPSI